ncbi:MAG: selenium-dependent xanthine dehydrogenase [Sphaerochaetaceae bacterium]|nr:selenium-dependent xanthine dehydrogenase [Sphaerochaetaceae bacterium]
MTTTFQVNGTSYTLDRDKKLIRFLRDDLKLTSVKDGCSEGACGTCTILIDGKTVKACTLLVSEVNGKSIITVEGLTEREKEIYTYAFGQAGAVQCGFCIPGMVMCAKGLLDTTLEPTELDIRHAIRNNICRCTGYAKIVKAIELAAKIMREDAKLSDDKNWKIGSRVPRVDVKDKVTGVGKYPDDLYFDNMLFAVAVRSKYPRARVLDIDRTLALDVPGVVDIFTADDIPGDRKVGHLKRDWDAMIPVGGITRYLGDVICLVAAQSYEAAKKAAKLVHVSYEKLPFVGSPYEAMKDDAPQIHEGGNLLGHTHVDRGNVEEALKNSKYVLSEKFSTPWTEHAFLEPECAVSIPYGEDGVKIYSTDQGVFDTRRETAPMLGLPEEKVLVENCYVGGGFGGKEDVTVQHLSALVAYLTKRPCKMKLTREESILVHPKRHPMDMEFTLGCDENGIIQALKAKVIADTGAYASLGIPVLQRACTHASGPYNYQNFAIDGYSYYTNNPPAGAFRGFGVTQTCFGIETLLNFMADKVGISHWEIRYRNAIRPGQALPNGQIVDNSTGLVETLLAVKDAFYANEYTGIACAMKNAGVGVGLPDFGRVRLEVKDKKVIIHCGGSCIGQGMCTVMKQIVCDVAQLDSDLVVEEKANTFNAPDSGTTSGSRHTTVTGEAARRAALALKEALEGKTLSDLEGQEFYAEYLAKTDPFGSDLPNPKSHVAYGYATQICILRSKTNKIEKIVAAHDVGRAINPTNVEGQIEGGVVMGMGYALKEQYPLENCKPLAKYGSLRLFRADEVPTIEPVIVEKAGLDVASGGIGIGEITSIPTAPAIADAYYRYDGEKRTTLPIINTPYEDLEEKSPRKSRTLVVNRNARCIGCMECVHACSNYYFRTNKASMAFIRVIERKGIGNFSEISGTITRPAVCIQCGKCAKACPIGAIKQNQYGAYVVDIRMCINCGKCREACPFGVMVEDTDLNVTKKCLACGKCVEACPMGVLSVYKPSAPLGTSFTTSTTVQTTKAEDSK